jgi:hypothetical protein
MPVKAGKVFTRRALCRGCGGAVREVKDSRKFAISDLGLGEIVIRPFRSWKSCVPEVFEFGKGALVMKSVSFARACCLGLSGLAVLVTSVGPGFAGAPVPAPLVGVAGPYGLVVAGAAYGGYLLYKRFQNRG